MVGSTGRLEIRRRLVKCWRGKAHRCGVREEGLKHLRCWRSYSTDSAGIWCEVSGFSEVKKNTH